VTAVNASDVYYDPYNVNVNADPYPIYRRLRDEAPLYYNPDHDFYALSRFDDVDQVFSDAKTYISGRGDVLEMIKADIEFPPGVVIFEDPPVHTKHRKLLSGVFTPRKVAALEPKIREFCVRCLDPLIGTAALTSSPISARWCRCGRSACSSASPRRIRSSSATEAMSTCKPRPGSRCRPLS
jgi:cytochrome P450